MNDRSAVTGTAIPLGRDRARDVIQVLCDAFSVYPVMRFVLDDRHKAYERRLRTLIHFLVRARVLRDEPMLGIAEGGRLMAAATISYPHTTDSPAELDALREATWTKLGAAARARYEVFGAATGTFSIETPYVELNMIGVRARAQGTGLGRRLLERVHRHSREDLRSEGVKLTTEDPANVRLYERLGYEIIGHARVVPELETWGMFRPD